MGKCLKLTQSNKSAKADKEQPVECFDGVIAVLKGQPESDGEGNGAQKPLLALSQLNKSMKKFSIKFFHTRHGMNTRGLSALLPSTPAHTHTYKQLDQLDFCAIISSPASASV